MIHRIFIPVKYLIVNMIFGSSIAENPTSSDNSDAYAVTTTRLCGATTVTVKKIDLESLGMYMFSTPRIGISNF
jgi:hypothetical protein